MTDQPNEALACPAHASTGRHWPCSECRRLWKRAYYQQRLKPTRQARRTRRLDQQRCSYCGQPLEAGSPYQRCADCRAYFAAKQSESRARRRTE